jgi:hypothetical protein
MIIISTGHEGDFYRYRSVFGQGDRRRPISSASAWEAGSVPHIHIIEIIPRATCFWTSKM